MRRALTLATCSTLLLVSAPAPPVGAAPRMEVTPATDLDPAGQQVQVRGSGFDPERGIYVAWCVVPPKAQKPTPCGGGDDRSGQGGSSAWISSNPVIGAAVAKPYGPGGSFDVQISVSRHIGDVDCFVVACAVTTRNDHENTDDRTQDVFVPVRFRGQPAPAEPAPGTTAVPAGTPAPAPAAPTTAASSPAVSPSIADAATTVPMPPGGGAAAAATADDGSEDDDTLGSPTAAAASSSPGSSGGGDDDDGPGTAAVAVAAALALAGAVGAFAVRRRWAPS